MSGPLRISTIVSLALLGLMAVIAIVTVSTAIGPPPAIAPKATTAATAPQVVRYRYNGSEKPWIQQAGLLAWLRAVQDRDEHGRLAVIHNYKAADINTNDTVMVTVRQGDIIQIENQGGVRGWTTASALSPR